MDDSLIIGVRPEPGYVIITAAGEIDIFTVARLREQLFTLAGHGRPLIADLDRVTSLHVVCARPQTRQLLQLTGLDRALRLARTLAEALKDMPAAPDPAARPDRPPRPVPAPPGGDDDDDD